MDKNVDELLEELKSPDDDTRKRAVLVLSKHPEPRVVEAMKRLQEDPSTAVRYFAKKALRDFEGTKGAPAAAPPLPTPEPARPQVAVAASDDPLMPVLGEAVIRKAEVIPERESISSLLAALKHEDMKVRLETIKKFGETKELLAVDPLLEIMNGDIRDLRVYAVQSLGLIGEQRVLTPLLNLLNSEEDAFVKATLVKAIARVGGVQLIPILARYLKDPDARTRANTVESLEIIADPKIIKFLVPLLQDENSRVKANVVKVLSKFGKSNMMEHLEEMLRSNDDHIRSSAIYALNKIGGEGVVRALVASLSDPNVGNVLAALEGLAKLDADEARDAIRDMLNHPNPKVRSTAQALLTGGAVPEGQEEPPAPAAAEAPQRTAEPRPAPETQAPAPASSDPLSDPKAFQQLWDELNGVLLGWRDRHRTLSTKDLARLLAVVLDGISEN